MMDKFLKRIFALNNFDEIELKKNLEFNREFIEEFKKNIDFTVYCNKKSETYIVINEEVLDSTLIDKILKICGEYIYKLEELSKAQKSNLYILITSRQETLSNSDKNIIFQIEENSLYYKKFVLWYTSEELKELEEALGSYFTLSDLESLIIDKELFKTFKKNESNLYNVLSRIYIKLAFLTLMNLEPLNQSLSGFMEEKLNELESGIFKYIKNEESAINFEKLYEAIELNSKELAEIELKIEGVIDEK